jgi:phage tail-like protein
MSNALAPIGRAPPARRDLAALETVVRVGYPVRAAMAWLQRHLGNPVGFRLVEAQRGEKVGVVRAIDIVPASGGEAVTVRSLRQLPDGTPATWFTPDDLVDVVTQVVTPDGRPAPPLGPRDRLILRVPVQSYLRFLPAIYQGAAPAQRRDIVKSDEVSARRWGAKDQVTATEVAPVDVDALRRFLFLFQHVMTGVTDRIDSVASLVDPGAADPRFLPWLASWVGFELDTSLPLHRQRELVRRAIRLYRSRGTVAGMEEMIRVLTGAPLRLVERRRPDGFIVGRARLAGGATPEDRMTRGEPAPSYVMDPARPGTGFFVVELEPLGTFKARFGERAPAVVRRIVQILSNEKPAQLGFTVRFEG